MKRVNAGYEIIASVTMRGFEIVLGQHEKDKTRFVTWMCTGGDNYYWGHYLTSEIEAYKDFGTRIVNEADAPWF